MPSVQPSAATIPARVSVVIPTFNRAPFIEEAIDSVLRQDYSNLEILIVDDRSTDDTEQILRKLMGCHPEVSYLVNERRKGPSGARNTGILAASGDYVAFLDSDDVWLPGHLEKGVGFLEAHRDINVLFGNFRVEGPIGCNPLNDALAQKPVLNDIEKERVGGGFDILRERLFEALVLENFFHVCTAIVRGEAAKSVLFDETIRISEDRDFAARLVKTAGPAFGCRWDPTFVHRRHGANLSDFMDDDILIEAYRAHIYLFKRYLDELPLARFERKRLTRCIREKLLRLAYRYRRKHDLRLALTSVAKSAACGFSRRQWIEVGKIAISALTPKK